MPENRLLDQFNGVISSQWPSTNISEEYNPLNHRELFELAYHTNNRVGTRNIFIKLSQDEKKGGSRAILYSLTKKFTAIDAFEENLSITKYFSEGESGDKLKTGKRILLQKMIWQKNRFLKQS